MRLFGHIWRSRWTVPTLIVLGFVALAFYATSCERDIVWKDRDIKPGHLHGQAVIEVVRVDTLYLPCPYHPADGAK